MKSTVQFIDLYNIPAATNQIIIHICRHLHFVQAVCTYACAASQIASIYLCERYEYNIIKFNNQQNAFIKSNTDD